MVALWSIFLWTNSTSFCLVDTRVFLDFLIFSSTNLVESIKNAYFDQRSKSLALFVKKLVRFYGLKKNPFISKFVKNKKKLSDCCRLKLSRHLLDNYLKISRGFFDYFEHFFL